MNVINKHNISIYSTIFLSFIVIMTSLSMFNVCRQNEVYRLLFLLPLSNGIVLLFISPWSFRIYSNIAKFIIFSLYTLRNILTPFLMSIGGFHTIININSEKEVNFALFLMIYETVAVFFTLIIIDESKFNREKVYDLKDYDRGRIRILKVMMVLLTAFSMFALYRIPMLRDNFESIFSSEVANIAKIISKERLPVGSIDRIVYTLAQMIINFLRLFLSVWILGWLKKRTNSKIIATISILILIALQSLFIPSQAIYIVYIITLIIIVSIKLFPSTLSVIKKLIPVFILVFIFTLFITKLKLNKVSVLSINEILSSSFQAYLPGVVNNAGILNIPLSDKLSHFFGDIYYMIPFRNSIFGFDVIDLNNSFNEYNNVKGQILPLLGQSYYYFGFLLAPLLPVIFALGAIKANMKANCSKDLFHYSTFIMLMLYFSTMSVTKNATLFGSTYFTTILPMLILCHFVDKDYEFSSLLK